jgi:DNA-binding CsgD family transcriptional regulator
MEFMPMNVSDAAWQALNVCPLGLMFSTHHLVRWCNPRFALLLGYEQARLSGQPLAIFRPDSQVQEGADERALQRLGAVGGYLGERLLRLHDGSAQWFRVRGEAMDRGDPFFGVSWTLEPLTGGADALALAPRDRDMLGLMVRGHTAKTCAHKLSLSLRTVEKLRGDLRARYGAHNSPELLRRIGGLPHG